MKVKHVMIIKVTRIALGMDSQDKVGMLLNGVQLKLIHRTMDSMRYKHAALVVVALQKLFQHQPWHQQARPQRVTDAKTRWIGKALMVRVVMTTGNTHIAHVMDVKEWVGMPVGVQLLIIHLLMELMHSKHAVYVEGDQLLI